MSSTTDPIVIASIARTPMGKFRGCLKTLSCIDLGAAAIRSACKRIDMDVESVDEVIMGCVLTAGLGQAPARQAALAANLPLSCCCTTVNKMCGSGMKAVTLAVDSIKAGSAKIVIAGGMESMSNAPFLLKKYRSGQKMGHSRIYDHMFLDGLEDPQDRRLMGCYAEDCAEDFTLSRERQDRYALESLNRANRATQEGHFDWEISPLSVSSGAQQITVSHDQQPAPTNMQKIASLESVFKPGGSVTAANSSSISDGAAALVLMAESTARQYGIEPLARIVAAESYATRPAHFTRAPVPAIKALLNHTGLDLAQVDLFEINEAFAVVPLLAMQKLDIPAEKLNVHGGACALGHPIGASGARILVTLCASLRQYSGRLGIAAICIGGGEAMAIMIERWRD